MGRGDSNVLRARCHPLVVIALVVAVVLVGMHARAVWWCASLRGLRVCVVGDGLVV